MPNNNHSGYKNPRSVAANKKAARNANSRLIVARLHAKERTARKDAKKAAKHAEFVGHAPMVDDVSGDEYSSAPYVDLHDMAPPTAYEDAKEHAFRNAFQEISKAALPLMVLRIAYFTDLLVDAREATQLDVGGVVWVDICPSSTVLVRQTGTDRANNSVARLTVTRRKYDTFEVRVDGTHR